MLMTRQIGEMEFIASAEGGREQGPCSQVDLGYVPKVFREPVRGFHDLLKQKSPPLLIL
jgi:hypothetical protein